MSKHLYLDFERLIAKIEELRYLGGKDVKGVDIAEEVDRLKAKGKKRLHAPFIRLTLC